MALSWFALQICGYIAKSRPSPARIHDSKLYLHSWQAAGGASLSNGFRMLAFCSFGTTNMFLKDTKGRNRVSRPLNPIRKVAIFYRNVAISLKCRYQSKIVSQLSNCSKMSKIVANFFPCDHSDRRHTLRSHLYGSSQQERPNGPVLAHTRCSSNLPHLARSHPCPLWLARHSWHHPARQIKPSNPTLPTPPTLPTLITLPTLPSDTPGPAWPGPALPSLPCQPRPHQSGLTLRYCVPRKWGILSFVLAKHQIPANIVCEFFGSHV